MISRMKFYMTFDAEWTQSVEHPGGVLQDALEEGFDKIGEVFLSFDYDEGCAKLHMMSERDSELMEDIITEILLSNVPNLSQSNFYIEIDLDVEVTDYNDF
jgi:hypothetical protein